MFFFSEKLLIYWECSVTRSIVMMQDPFVLDNWSRTSNSFSQFLLIYCQSIRNYCLQDKSKCLLWHTWKMQNRVASVKFLIRDNKMVHHENVPCHSFLAKIKTPVVPWPPSSHDLSPSDKSHLKESHLKTIENIQINVNNPHRESF